ncbi:MAG: hypothetical protein HY580_06905 [Nitrospinae bacterium]|nr:hypothetical protein [Nitrospinota bacterium]
MENTIQKSRQCPKCQTPLNEPYQRAYMEDDYYEFYACESCGKEFSHVYKFSRIEMDEDEPA